MHTKAGEAMMEMDDGDSAGESTNASWVNMEDLGRSLFVFKSS